MNDDERRTAEARLRKIPNVGPATARDLIALGIVRPEDAAGKDPDALYKTLCVADGVCRDPCVRDVCKAARASVGEKTEKTPRVRAKNVRFSLHSGGCRPTGAPVVSSRGLR